MIHYCAYCITTYMTVGKINFSVTHVKYYGRNKTKTTILLKAQKSGVPRRQGTEEKRSVETRN